MRIKNTIFFGRNLTPKKTEMGQKKNHFRNSRDSYSIAIRNLILFGLNKNTQGFTHMWLSFSMTP